MNNTNELLQELIDNLIANGPESFESYRIKKGITKGEWTEMTELGLQNKYLRTNDHRTLYTLLPKGTALQNGGYLRLINQQQTDKTAETKIAIERQQRQDDKLKLDLLQVKRQVKWFYPLLIISFIGVIGTGLSIYNIIHQIKEENKQATINKSIFLLTLQQKADSIHALQNEIQKK